MLVSARPARAQSSFDTDPFGPRFRERANFDVKFKPPERGGPIRIDVPEGEGGRQSVVGETHFEAEAPPGKRVTLTYDTIVLRARRVRADSKTKAVVAEGEVELIQAGSRLRGDRLDIDLDTKVGVVTQGAVDLEGGLHLEGALIAKVGPKSFTLTDGTLSACEGDDPAWLFSMKSGRITLEEYVRLKAVVFRLGGVPLLYTPYLLWPAMSDRVSGFLVPGIGYNSSRGANLGLSYFQTLGRSADATASADLYTKRYFGFGVEARVRPSEGTKASAVGYTVRDGETGRWQWKTLGLAEVNDLGPGWRAVASWLDYSDLAFFQSYDRDFALTSARSVKSQVFVTRTADPFTFNLRLDREKALFGDTEVVTERRPTLEARLRPTPILGPLVLFEARGQAGFLRAARGDGQPSGSYGRFDLFPKVSAPLSPLPWLSIQADAGGRVTWYGDSVDTLGTRLAGSSVTRRTFQAGVEMTGPSFSRLFDASLFGADRLKHVLEPRVDWDYVSDAGDPRRIPLFDEVDLVSPAHTIRYALVQRLLGKTKQAPAREIASLEIGQTYYVRLPGEGTPAGASPNASRRSPIDFLLRVSGGTNLSLDGRLSWDHAAGQVTSASLTTVYASSDRSLRLSLFDSNPVTPPGSVSAARSTQLRFGGGTPIVPKLLRFDVEANYDLSRSRMLESRTLLTFEGSCFKVLAEYRDLRITGKPQRDFRIALNLKNIGSFLDFRGNFGR